MSNEKSEKEHLENTIEVLENSIEKESKTGASPKITSWIKTLNGMDGFKTIVSDLEKLQTAIADKDGNKVATLMEKLGEATVAKAEKSDDKDSASIKKLGKGLIKVAKFIGKSSKEE
jgi:hypothetical protein